MARHRDVVNEDGTQANDTIDTTSLVDGLGRVVQRKRDAEVEGVTGQVMIVEGAAAFDALGRVVQEWFPVVESQDPWPATGLPGHLTTYDTRTSADGGDTRVPITGPTVRTFDLLDRLTATALPDGRVERRTYDIADVPGTAVTSYAPTVVDPLGGATRRFVDVRGVTLVREDYPAGWSDLVPTGPATPSPTPLDALPTAGLGPAAIVSSTTTPQGALTTTYDYDALGRLVQVTDVAGAVTTHAYDLADNRTTTTTPDAGTVTWDWTPAGSLAREVTAALRASGDDIRHEFRRDRLLATRYSDDTPEVLYTYGAAGAAENAAGRVVRVVDGASTRTFGYDVDGNVARETSTRLADPFGTGRTESGPTFETSWSYDSMRRRQTMTYPTGEVLTTGYDLGGRPDELTSVAPQFDRYDAFGAAVPQPDLDLSYVTDVGYDEFGAVRRLTHGNGVESVYGFDATSRLLTTIATDVDARTTDDGTSLPAAELQALRYAYDAVGNITGAANALYDGATPAGSLDELGDIPANGLPGASQHAYSYDDRYRLVGAEARYVDRQEDRTYLYEAAYGANGNLLTKRQGTTTVGTTGNGGGGNGGNGGGNGNGGGGGGNGNGGGNKDTGGQNKKNDGDDVPDGTTTTDTPTCDAGTGSGGGVSNQDAETTYAYAAGDLTYDAAHPHRLVGAGDRAYSYDPSGRVTRWVQPCAGGNATDVREFIWDAEGRVTLVGQGNNDTEYRYDADGARALERGPGGLRWFVNEQFRIDNDGHRYAEVFLGERRVASHRTSGAPTPPPVCDPAVEVCGCDPATQVCDCSDPTVCSCDDPSLVVDAVDGTCTARPDPLVHHLHDDLQGSLRVATDEDGRVFQYVDYLPTGRPWVAGQSRIQDTPYLFAGGWTDATYDMVNFGERWYDPREEIFFSPEPLLVDEPGVVDDDPTMLAAYTYAGSNPLRYVDVDGRAPRAVQTLFLRQASGDASAKHQRGTITIGVGRRDDRDSPAITFGGRFTNDDATLRAQERRKELADAFDRYTTLFSYDASDGKVRIGGFTVAKRTDSTGDDSSAVPQVNAVSSGADDGSDTSTQPPPPARASSSSSLSSSSSSVDDSSSEGGGGLQDIGPPDLQGGAADQPPPRLARSQSAPLLTSRAAGGSAAANGPDDD